VASASRGAVDRLSGGEMQTATSRSGSVWRQYAHTLEDALESARVEVVVVVVVV